MGQRYIFVNGIIERCIQIGLVATVKSRWLWHSKLAKECDDTTAMEEAATIVNGV